ncbi:hypothetical protein ILUMI_19797 [Ignelater luminosus]|uniref:Uncharacterized protein n=1 Tax=Ignelater luminosus TaxID=2038154 RepID=A0A8K0CJS0_IGNLU|nr:hypothetical protein ILUMI_19797 [Ignelater luminosus]
MGKYNFTTDRIYNCNETGVTTVWDPPRVFVKKGLKQVGQATSGESGELVTVLNFVNASGSVRFKQFMLTGAPLGSLGLAYRSG